MGEEITFDGSASTGDIVYYSWGFSDGTEEHTTSSTHKHTFEHASNYHYLHLYVYSDTGSDMCSVDVIITN